SRRPCLGPGARGPGALRGGARRARRGRARDRERDRRRSGGAVRRDAAEARVRGVGRDPPPELPSASRPIGGTVPKNLTTLDNHFDELELGDSYVSGERTLSAEDIAAFSALSGDSHPLHTDPDWARDIGPFGAQVAQGCLTLSLATGLEFDLIGASGT